MRLRSHSGGNRPTVTGGQPQETKCRSRPRCFALAERRARQTRCAIVFNTPLAVRPRRGMQPAKWIPMIRRRKKCCHSGRVLSRARQSLESLFTSGEEVVQRLLHRKLTDADSDRPFPERGGDDVSFIGARHSVDSRSARSAERTGDFTATRRRGRRPRGFRRFGWGSRGGAWSFPAALRRAAIGSAPALRKPTAGRP